MVSWNLILCISEVIGTPQSSSDVRWLEVYTTWVVVHPLYGCFLKWWYPQNTPKWSFLVGKPIVGGYHHFRKPLHALNNQVFFSLQKCIFSWNLPPRHQCRWQFRIFKLTSFAVFRHFFKVKRPDFWTVFCHPDAHWIYVFRWYLW